MLTDCYRRRIATTVIQLAKDDPVLVKEVVDRLRAAGEIEADDLVYLDRHRRFQRSTSSLRVHRTRVVRKRRSLHPTGVAVRRDCGCPFMA